MISERLANPQAAERTVLDVSALTNGTYVVRMSSESKSLASKLIIRK